MVFRLFAGAQPAISAAVWPRSTTRRASEAHANARTTIDRSDAHLGGNERDAQRDPGREGAGDQYGVSDESFDQNELVKSTCVHLQRPRDKVDHGVLQLATRQLGECTEALPRERQTIHDWTGPVRPVAGGLVSPAHTRLIPADALLISHHFARITVISPGTAALVLDVYRSLQAADKAAQSLELEAWSRSLLFTRTAAALEANARQDALEGMPDEYRSMVSIAAQVTKKMGVRNVFQLVEDDVANVSAYVFAFAIDHNFGARCLMCFLDRFETKATS